MDRNSNDSREQSPIIIYYDSLEGLEHLWPRLAERFRETGHTRPVVFREYDSYKELPGTDGDLLYMLPADMAVFRRLAQADDIYAHLYGLLDSGENGILRYGKRFYENFYRRRDLLLQLLWKKAGWEPGLLKQHLEKRIGRGKYRRLYL